MSNQHSFIYSRIVKTLYLVTFPSTHIHVILPLFHSLHVCISIYSLMGLQKGLWIHQCPSLKRQQKDSFSILLILLDFLYCRFYVLNYLVSKWTRVTYIDSIIPCSSLQTCSSVAPLLSLFALDSIHLTRSPEPNKNIYFPLCTFYYFLTYFHLSCFCVPLYFKAITNILTFVSYSYCRL